MEGRVEEMVDGRKGRVDSEWVWKSGWIGKVKNKKYDLGNIFYLFSTQYTLLSIPWHKSNMFKITKFKIFLIANIILKIFLPNIDL